MAITVSSLQVKVRTWMDDDNVVLTGASNLAVVNEVYRGLLSPDYKLLGRQVGRNWPENTRENTATTLTAGTSQYSWPSSPQFILDTVYLEYLDVSNSNHPTPVYECTDMAEWTELTDGQRGTPIRWRLIDVSGTLKLDLRPIPDTTSDVIRITGQIEPTALTTATGSTIFRNVNIDAALSKFIAAAFKAKYGERDRAMDLISDGLGLMPAYDFNPRRRTRGSIAPWSP